MSANAEEIAIAIDQWITEIYSMDNEDLTPEEISSSLQDLCREFSIPEDIAKRAVERALSSSLSPN